MTVVLQTIEKQALGVVDQQEWLDQVSKPVQDSTSRVLSQQHGEALHRHRQFPARHLAKASASRVDDGCDHWRVYLRHNADVLEMTMHEKGYGKSAADASLSTRCAQPAG